MGEPIEADLCVIGGGSGGLSVAAGAVQMGARTVLIERGKMGGDCLNYGCVPSKSLIAAARSAHVIRNARKFGVISSAPEIDMIGVRQHVRNVISHIEPHDSIERFTGLGVQVIQASATFVDSSTVAAGGATVRAKWFVISTGSRPAVPPIPGLEDVEYFTNETLFENSILPDHLVVVGGGPIGCEMAQAYRRLGASVSLIDMGPILAKDDPTMVLHVRQALIDEGVALFEQSQIKSIAQGPRITIEKDGHEHVIAGSHLLIATGRIANTEGMALENAGVDFDKTGIQTDHRLRTSNKRIFAIGDVAGGMQFTHVAGYHAGVVIKNALFRIPSRAKHGAIPWVTYTDPELAHVGLTEEKARQEGHKVHVVEWSFQENDRAVSEADTNGGIKLVASRKGHILGVTIAGKQAGELIHSWVLAMQKGLKLAEVTGAVAAYPTRSEISKRVAGTFYSPTLFSEKTRRIVRWLMLLPN